MKKAVLVSNTNKKLADNLKKCLEKADISLADLSKKSGVSTATLSRILTEQVSPSFDNITKIAKALNTSLDSLSGETVIKPKAIVKPNDENDTHTNYSSETDILASFEIRNTDLTASEAARMLTSAANGTWVTHHDNLMVATDTPRVFPTFSMQIGTKKIAVELAFPHTYVEGGSMASLISVIGAAMVGTGARLVDIRIPTALVRTFKTPTQGIDMIRDGLCVFNRPLISVTMRPMTGLSPIEYAHTVCDMLSNGVDITCDPTMMHSLPEHTWRERTILCSRAVEDAYDNSGVTATHMVNISAGTIEEMLSRAEFAIKHKLKYLLVDSASVGFSALQSLTAYAEKHGAVIAAMGARSLQTLGMSEQVLAKMLRFTGCDIVSIPSPINDTVQTSRREVKGVITALKDDDYSARDDMGLHFDQPTCGRRSSMPACGGGHNPWHFPRLIDAMGNDCVIQCGANVMAHPDSIVAGAIANRKAIEALVEAKQKGKNLAVDGKKVLKNAALDCVELKNALKHWKEGNFLFGVIDGDKKNIKGSIHKS